MADIFTHLNAIKEAIYGKDVRQSIHDAIKECYYDGKAGAIDLEARERAAAAEARMDVFTALGNGSTTGDAELKDIRVGLDGTIYAAAGTAVREQIRETRVIEVTSTEPTRENTVMWINPEKKETIEVPIVKDGKEGVAQFNVEVILIKNEKGQFESVTALRGESIYEIAVRNGYVGSEDDYIRELMEEGWVNAVTKLESNKADKTELQDYYKKTQVDSLISGIRNEYQDAISDVVADVDTDLDSGNNIFKIGDIRATVRDDLGSKWALCDGSTISKSSYPDLYDMLGEIGIMTAEGVAGTGIFPDVSGYEEILCVTYGNGYWVVGGTYRGGSSGSYTYNAAIAYSTSLNGPWTVKTIWSGNSYTNYNQIRCITYANGYWVVGGVQYSSTYRAKLAYCTSLTGTWTLVDVWANSYGLNAINAIARSGSYWVIGGKFYSASSSTAARIAYSSSMGSSWTTKDLWAESNTYCEVTDLIYSGSYFVATGVGYSSGNIIRIAYVSSPSSTWTTKDILTSTNTYTSPLGIIKGGSYYVVYGQYYDGTTGHACIIYATSLSGTWRRKDIYDSVKDGANYRSYIESLCYVDGQWIAAIRDIGGSDFICMYASSLTGTWLEKTLSIINTYNPLTGDPYDKSNSIAYVRYGRTIYYDDDTIVIGGSYVIGSTSSTSHFSGFAYMRPKLPVITSDDNYYYIKRA